jgi:hypothetical protein
MLVLMVMTGLLAGCSATSRQATGTPPTARATSATAARQTLPGGPAATTPTPGQLGPPPRTCPPAPRSVVPRPVGPWSEGGVLGRSPAWAVGFGVFGRSGRAVLAVDPAAPRGQHGYQVKVLWVVAPGYKQPVQLHGYDRATGSPLWFQVGTESTAPILDPAHPGATDSGNPQAADPQNRYANFPSYLLIPVAGCYTLVVTWPGGSWTATFAAGLASP